MKHIPNLLFACTLAVVALAPMAASGASIPERLSGRILLQVENNGEGWYVHPVDQKRRYLGRPTDAFAIMRELGLGISNRDLTSLFGALPASQDAYASGNRTMALRLAGRILLQVESKGEAYYINPQNLRGYYLGRPADAFRIMREQGLGITTSDLSQITPTGRMPDAAVQAPKESAPPALPARTSPAQTQAPAQPVQTCVSNPNPVFTADITNLANLVRITPPGTILPDGDVKTHSFVWNAPGANNPVYAPVDVTLAGGGYYTEGGVNQYIMFFDVSCEVEVKFDHIRNPIDAVRNVLPSEPKLNDTRTTPATERLAFKAGDLIGYTVGNPGSGNWDFGVYNTTITNYLAAEERFSAFPTYTNAVCPYDYYQGTAREAYRVLYAGSGNSSVPTTFCQ
ncbi:MAG: hypothetical protein HYW81_00460 [Parcubacteria group bacterium]|nr:hypothetical protein [Parcubacteria group bacterium]